MNFAADESIAAVRTRTNRKRDAVIRAVQHTEDGAEQPTFSTRAIAVIVATLRQERRLSAEDLTKACRAAGIVPKTDDRAFGGVYQALVRRGVIEKVATVRRERGNGTSGGSVYALTEKARGAA